MIGPETEEDQELAPRPPQPKSWKDIEAITGGLKGVSLQLLERGRKDWDYHFKELGECGREGCETKHGWGILMAIPGRRFVNIGHDCADRYTSEVAWSAINRAYKAQRQHDAFATAISNVRDEALLKQAWLDSIALQISHATALKDSFLEAVGGPLRRDIVDRAEKYRVRIEREVKLSEEERETRRAMLLGGRVDKVDADVHVPLFDLKHFGDLQGIELFRAMRDPKSLAERLRKLISTLIVWSDTNPDPQTAKLMQRAMRDFGPFTADLMTSLRAADVFFSDANLNSLMELPVTRSQGIKKISVEGHHVRIARAEHWNKVA